MKHNAQRGSAIIMIFIAIALFAALGYAFFQSTRTSSSMMTNSSVTAEADKYIQYANDLRGAVQRLKLRGCKETEISFENTYNASYAFTTKDTCKVFSPVGGGLKHSFDVGIGNPNSGDIYTGDVPFAGVGTSRPDLGAQITIGPGETGKALCVEINKKLGLSDSNANNYQDDIAPLASLFVGTYGVVNIVFISGDEVASFNGKNTYCRRDGGGNHFFMAVLLPR